MLDDERIRLEDGFADPLRHAAFRGEAPEVIDRTKNLEPFG
jgi:hypothetical protein